MNQDRLPMETIYTFLHLLLMYFSTVMGHIILSVSVFDYLKSDSVHFLGNLLLILVGT